ncbi:rod shape-determining protein MreC [Candidatus Hakubella thermalkaliphila]|nr:rod shape-determining protein MreC [Candidatus Hakubella thermalkaliphila]
MPSINGSHKNQIVLVILIVLSILVATFQFRQNEGQILTAIHENLLLVFAPVQKGVVTLIRPLTDIARSVQELGTLRQENQALRAEASELRMESARLQEVEAENRELRKLLGAPARQKFETVLATVIGRSFTNWHAAIVIDKGRDHGVEVNMPVITDRGLVGKVTTVSRNAAEVQLIIDPQSSVGGRDVSTRARGIVEGTMTDILKFNYVPKDSRVEKGNRVVTSGYGGIYPSGILIGKVSQVEERRYDFYQQIEVVPFVDFDALEKVLIITNASPRVDFQED